MTKVACVTIAYNAEKTLRQTVESVLGQTHENLEYVLVDHGSTDSTKQIIEAYSRLDARVHPIYEEKNYGSGGVLSLLINQAKHIRCKWLAILDADDWWEPNYLERLLWFQEKNQLDIALTGTITDFEEAGTSRVLRKLEQPAVLTRTQFALAYPQFWIYPSTVWASILRTELFASLDGSHLGGTSGDTRLMLQYLNKCQRIGIDNSALYHYRIWSSMNSNQYDPGRFEANLAYCDHIRAFLVRHNALDAPKKDWLKRVYLASIGESVRLALGAQNTLHEKLKVCGEIASHPQTADALQSTSNERTAFLDMLRQLASTAIQRGARTDFDELPPILRLVCPRCSAYASEELLKLCQKDAALLSLFLQDDLTSLALALEERITQGRYAKQFDLPGILAGLLPENPLSAIRDAKFYRKYPSLCTALIKGHHIEVLDQMTEALMNHQVSYGTESYLQLYLTLAALVNQVPAFLFGKVQLAEFYFNEKNRDACANVLSELDEMGMGTHEDVQRLKAALRDIGPTQ